MSSPRDVNSAEGDSEKAAVNQVDCIVQDGDLPVISVDFEENDAENPLNWSPLRKWLIVIAVAMMGFVSVFATFAIIPTAPQILQEFHSHNALDRTLIVTIWELGEGLGPFFIAPLSERFGRLPIFHLGNLLSLCCLVASALSVNIAMIIAFRFLTGCFLPVLTLGPAIVGDLFQTENTGLAIALVMGIPLIADFTSPVGGAYIARDLGWRWSIWLTAIVLVSFALLLLLVLRETYAVVILRRKAQRLQRQNANNTYRSTHQARIDASTVLESALRPMQILTKSPVLILTTAYMATTYALVCLILATLTETMESTYPSTFTRGSIGLTFLSLAIGNTSAVLIYSFTSDRYVVHKQKTQGTAFKPESRLVHLLVAAVVLPIGFLIYGWALAFRVQYIVPLVGTCAAGFSIILSALPTETYVVDVYKVHGASAIAAGVIARAISGAILPLIGPPLYKSIGYGWGNSVLSLIAAVFIPPLALLLRYGDWFRSKDSFGPSGR